MKNLKNYLENMNEGLSISGKDIESILSASITTAAVDFKHGNVKESDIEPLFLASKYLKLIKTIAEDYAENEEDPELAETEFNIKLHEFANFAMKKFGWVSKYMLEYYATNLM